MRGGRQITFILYKKEFNYLGVGGPMIIPRRVLIINLRILLCISFLIFQTEIEVRQLKRSVRGFFNYYFSGHILPLSMPFFTSSISEVPIRLRSY